jgi:mxaJ protein
MQRDLNFPPSQLIDDLVKGDLDVAIVWGPIAGYFAKHASIPLEVVMIPEYESQNIHGKENWNISIGVRNKDKARQQEINAALERRKADIEKILDEYGVPHIPIVAGDDIVKKAHEVNESAKVDKPL